ncbi:MAG: 50S ribosomal protein L24 [Candidatus Levybacteria bacterium RIFCSPLOWO2_01_FULL_39_10]|nr:MAG: 50S ribosomal protein L24 [Candidatus Levybacteria bacterium RIFCSPLOWO2_01_FULL_39_10]
MKLKREDEVIVVRGKDKGKKGKIEKVYPRANLVLLPGANLYKRHYKSPVQNRPSEIIEITKPLPAGNVALICPKCHKKTRVGYKMDNKEKVRICRKCKKRI